MINHIKFSNYNKNLKFYDDLSILDNLIDRVMTDKEFRKRQRIIGTISILVKALGLLNVFKIFPDLMPYMKLEFSKK